MKDVIVLSLTRLNKGTSVSLSNTYEGPIVVCLLEGWYFQEAFSLDGKTRQNKDNTKKHSIKTQWMLKSSSTGVLRNDRGRVR